MAFLEMVVGAIVELGVQSPLEKAWDSVKHKEAVLKVLKKVNLHSESPPDEFEAIYTYTLVEWGVFKPEPLLNFFRHQFVRDAFRRAYYEGDPTLLEKEAQEIISWNQESGELGRIHQVPTREIEAFRDVFQTVVAHARSPIDVRQEGMLTALMQANATIQKDIERILTHFEATPSDSEILAPYLEAVERNSSRLRLTPLDSSGREAEGAHIALNQVFVNLDAEKAGRTLPASPTHPARKMEYRAAIAHIFTHPRLILLGDPGSGKSTLLRFLAYGLTKAALEPTVDWLKILKWDVYYSELEDGHDDEARKFLEEDGSQSDVERVEKHWAGTPAPIPLLVELRDFAQTRFESRSPTAIWEFVRAHLQLQFSDDVIDLLQQYAARGQVIFLLDGVDEVLPERRRAIWQAIIALQEGVYGGNRWVATCRVLSFSADEAPAGIPFKTLKPWRLAQITAFIERWYGVLVAVDEVSQAEGQLYTTRLSRAVQDKQLQRLAQNPMLLTIMVLVQTYRGSLPDERVKLYQACVTTLLHNWQRHKELREDEQMPHVLAALDVREDVFEQMLWEIAWQAHSQAPERAESADIGEYEVLKIGRKYLGSLAKVEQFLSYTERRAHLLVGRGGIENRVYTFPHRTIQEYLAACHLASGRRFKRQAPKLAAQGEMWREVLNLAAGTLVFNWKQWDRVLDVVEYMLPEEIPQLGDEAGWFRIWLAAEMTTVVGLQQVALDEELGQVLLPKLRQQLTVLLTKGCLTPRQRAEAGDALAHLGDLRQGVCDQEPDMVPIPAGEFLMRDPPHPIMLEAFGIGRYPITNAQFRYFVDGDGYNQRDYWTEEGWHYRKSFGWENPSRWQNELYNQDNQPVVGVSWYEAVAYVRWLCQETGKPYRLPTEAEWERASRYTDGRRYPWGDEWHPDATNFEDLGVGRPMAVGIFPYGVTQEGVCDMSGNVWEWCQTRWCDEKRKEYPLPYQANDGRELLSGDSSVWRILRGGSFVSRQDRMRCAFRLWNSPDLRLRHYGFRVVCSPFFTDVL